MNRRTFSRSILAAAFLPGWAEGPRRPAATRAALSLQSGIFRFPLGEFTCHVISDGVWTGGTETFLFGDPPPAEVGELMARHGDSARPFRIPVNCLVVRTPRLVVAIDTGTGALSESQAEEAELGQYGRNLAAAGLRPEDVDAVVFTHGHPDHFGGVLDASGRVAFPRARFFMAEAEAQNLQAGPEWALARLHAITDRLTRVTGQTTIEAGVTLIPVGAHTPGHMLVRFTSEARGLLCIGDLIAHELHVERPAWSMVHEADRARAAAIRDSVLNAASASHQLLFSAHMPFPGIGRIVREGPSMRWEAAAV